jgi:hypothetical protein
LQALKNLHTCTIAQCLPIENSHDIQSACFCECQFDQDAPEISEQVTPQDCEVLSSIQKQPYGGSGLLGNQHTQLWRL